MLSIGVGPALILACVLGATVFGIPMVILAPIAALVMCAAAYGVSRDPNTRHIGFVVVGIVVGKMLVKFVNSALVGQTQQLPDWPQVMANALTSDGVVIAVSAIAFVLALLLGIFGPMRHLETVEEVPEDPEGR